jgi:hypothetical protein
VSDLHALIQHLRTQPASTPLPATPSVECKRVKKSEGAIIKYQLLFGRTVEVVNPLDLSNKEKTIQLAELTQVFLQVLQASKIPLVVQLFQDKVEHTANGLAVSNTVLDSMSNVPAGMFDSFFITCLPNFRWAKGPYNMDRKSVRNRLGSPHFAAPSSTLLVEFITWLASTLCSLTFGCLVPLPLKLLPPTHQISGSLSRNS